MDSAFPIIDISSMTEKYLDDEDYLKPITSDPVVQDISKQIIDAFEEYGFIYIKGHNIPDELIQGAFKTAEEFFKLDLAVKNSLSRNTDENWGYVPFNIETFEKQRPFDLKECFNYLLKTSRKDDMDKVSPDFIPTFSKFYTIVKSLSMLMLKAISFKLKTEDKESFLYNHHDGIGDDALTNPTTLRLLYYPSIEKKETVKKDQLRCGEHSDYGTITLLFQDDAGGLQVVSPSGEYVDAKPIPGCIVVNAGDMLQIWSGKKIKSTRHRVLVPENLQKPRQSMAFFVHPNNNSVVTDLENPDSGVAVDPYKYLMGKFSDTYG